MKKLSIVWLGLAVLIAGCATTPVGDIQVAAEKNPKIDLCGYSTYAWLGSAAIVQDQYGQWEPPEFDADAEIRSLIDTQLSELGLSESMDDPEMVVAFAAGIDMDALELNVDPDSDVEELANVPKGALVMALVDADTGFVIWWGKVLADIQENIDAETAKARLEYAVTTLFEDLSCKSRCGSKCK